VILSDIYATGVKTRILKSATYRMHLATVFHTITTIIRHL